ncbi:hypothetical protein [Micromonospora sp. NPDC007230]|uniref:hypothetical protein n=1 Tax=Micromonospora sp. NPDC007230 TaxID=3364237 RepID=UPI0036C7A017
MSERELRALVDAAERDRLGWDPNDIVPDEKDMYLLLPYSYEERPVRLWKCRVLAFANGLAVEVGKGKKILYGRLDVSLAAFRRLPPAPRKVERQLLHWLAWKAATVSWKETSSSDRG